LVFGSAGSIAGTVYGTIIVMATLTAGSNAGLTDVWRLSVIVVATVLVLWIAHVYAHALAESLERRRRLDRRARSVARRELAIWGRRCSCRGAVLGAPVLEELTAAWPRAGIGVVTLKSGALCGRYSCRVQRAAIALNVFPGL
jgi:hypothetical protein